MAAVDLEIAKVVTEMVVASELHVTRKYGKEVGARAWALAPQEVVSVTETGTETRTGVAALVIGTGTASTGTEVVVLGTGMVIATVTAHATGTVKAIVMVTVPAMAVIVRRIETDSPDGMTALHHQSLQVEHRGSFAIEFFHLEISGVNLVLPLVQESPGLGLS